MSVITTDITGSVEVLRDYHNLTVVQPGSVDDIEYSLKKIFSNQNNKKIKPFSSINYSWMNVAKEILILFQR